jgi:catechol 2,3-dioxygenase-like lactoylglutathione lyase family enzyme
MPADQPSADAPLVPAARLAKATLVCADIAESRRFYEEFFGFECAKLAPDRLLLRAGVDWFLEVTATGSVSRPQGVFNHWGFDVASNDDVLHAHQMATEHKDRFGIRRVQSPKNQHGSYSFYLQDRDSNWWEFQHRTATPDELAARGDVIPT